MANNRKNIGPEAEKPGDAPQEKKLKPVQDTPPAPEQPAPKLGLTVEQAAIL